MGTGWRRAFCTSLPRDTDAGGEKMTPAVENPSSSPSPGSCVKLGFFSNPSTPRLRIRTTFNAAADAGDGDEKNLDKDTPRLQCKTTTATPTAGFVANAKSPGMKAYSNPSSPRSPSRFALLRSLRLSRTSCGICMAGVKTGQGTAIFTAECGHAFHFPCIAGHVRKQSCLSCPVCSAVWRHAPLLALQHKVPGDAEDDVRAEPEKKLPPPPPPTTGLAPKVYDDDEPLLSPRFNPIPEADEDDGEGGGEFQGFFVDPVSPQPAAKAERIVEALLPEAAVISAGRSYESYAVMLRIKAPPALPPSNGGRAPVDLVVALDVGGVMNDSKLQMLKRAVRLVVASLGAADRLSLVVAFPGTTRRLLPLRRMTPKGQRVARRLVDLLVSGPGVAAVSDALRKATKVLEDRRERNPVATIMLLSDGQDEQPPATNRRQRHPSTTTRFAHVEIPVHSFGLGSGSGSNREALAKCVGGLLSVVVQDLRLHISFPSGEIPAVYSYTARPALVDGSSWVRLGDLYAEEERELLLELKVPAAVVGAHHHALAVKFAYRDPATSAPVQSKDQVLLVPWPSAACSGDPKAERLRSAFVAARAAAEARRLADRDEVDGAVQMLAAARALLLQSGAAAADENLRMLDGELAMLQCRRGHGSRRRGERGGYTHHHTATATGDENGEPLTPTSAWRAAEQLAKVAIMRKSMSRVSDLHGFENARF